MTDHVNLQQVRLHATLPEIVHWPVTKRIAGVELKRGDSFGIRLLLDPYNPAKFGDSWPDRVPAGWDGTIRWTLCLGVEIAGQWHLAAFQEFWHDRAWTGAPLHTTWADGWADPRGWAGPELTNHRPKIGDRILVFAAAGQLRMNKQAAAGNEHMLTVRERSNAVIFELAETASYTYAGEAPPVIVPPSPTVPTVAVPPTDDWKAVALQLSRALDAQAASIQELRAREDARADAQARLEQDLRDKQRQLDERLVILEDRPGAAIPTQAVFRVSYRDVALNREIVAGLR